jgi:hypothetical protein
MIAVAGFLIGRVMSRFFCIGLLLSSFVACTQARGDHFAIDLKVQAGKESKTAATDTAALGVKAKKRDVVHAKAGDLILVKWTMTNTDAKVAVKNVLVHFFAVKLDEIGQKVAPKLDKGVLAESALTMDFNPKEKARGELSFVVHKAGPYLIRLETIGAAVGDTGHEHFAALDLLVKGDE